MAVRGQMPEVKIPVSTSAGDEQVDHLGIVLVHGVGFQSPAETLVGWSDRLLRTINALWPDRSQPPDAVVDGIVDVTGGQQSFVEIRVPAAGERKEQRWLVTEAFWAASFQPPDIRTVLTWLGAKGGAARAAEGFAGVKWLVAVRQGVYITAIATALLVVYAALRLVLAVIPSLRNALTAPLDRLLREWSGDMRVMVFDSGQSASIRGRVMAAVHALTDAGFPNVAIIAHSGGAVASYMALTDSALRRDQDRPVITRLITLGQGLNAAWRLAGVGKDKNCADAEGTGVRLIRNIRELYPGLRWVDYYSVGDTVSDSAVQAPECIATAGPESDNLVLNRPGDSHGGYWDNDEEFVRPLVAVLTGAARRGRTPRPDLANWTLRRHQRISIALLTRRVLASVAITAVVAGVVAAGGRLDDVSRGAVTVLNQIPGHELITGPIGWLKVVATERALDGVRTFGIYLLMIMVLVAAVVPLIQLGSPRLAGADWRDTNPRFARALAGLDIAFAALPLLPLTIWALGVSLDQPDAGRGLPLWVLLIPMLVLVGTAIASLGARMVWSSLHRLWKRWLRPGGALDGVVGFLVTSALLVVVGATLGSVLVALLADAKLWRGSGVGTMFIGAAIVWLSVDVLRRMSAWRWNAWDEQEREQFRGARGSRLTDAGRRPLGRLVDLVNAGLAIAGGLLLLAAIAGPDHLVRPALITAAVVVVMIWLVGVAQDAENQRGGIEPDRASPLPMSSR